MKELEQSMSSGVPSVLRTGPAQHNAAGTRHSSRAIAHHRCRPVSLGQHRCDTRPRGVPSATGRSATSMFSMDRSWFIGTGTWGCLQGENCGYISLRESRALPLRTPVGRPRGEGPYQPSLDLRPWLSRSRSSSSLTRPVTATPSVKSFQKCLPTAAIFFRAVV